MIGGLRKLRRSERGVATVEFALWLTLFFTISLVAIDIAQFTIQRGRLAEAVSGASLSAFKTRDAVQFQSIPAYVQAMAAAPGQSPIEVTVGCNGGTGNCTNSSRVCACLSQTGSFIPTNSCGQSCGSGASANSRSGYYLDIVASYKFNPQFVPASLAEKAVITQKTTVRLQ